MNMKQVIIQKLKELYPDASGYAIYDEKAPESFQKPYFLVSITNQEYKKRMSTKYTSTNSFDVAYYSGKADSEIALDNMEVCQDLFEELDLVDTYRVRNKKAVFTDNVLHFTFDIQYSEMKVEEGTQMQQLTANTTI